MQAVDREHERVDRHILEVHQALFQLLAEWAIWITEDIHHALAVAFDCLDGIRLGQLCNIDFVVLFDLACGQILLGLHVEQAAKEEVATRLVHVGDVLAHHHFVDAGNRGAIDFFECGRGIQALECCQHRRIHCHGTRGCSRGCLCRCHACQCKDGGGDHRFDGATHDEFHFRSIETPRVKTMSTTRPPSTSTTGKSLSASLM